MKLVEKISRSPRYETDVTVTDLLCLEELGGGEGISSEKSEKIRYF